MRQAASAAWSAACFQSHKRAMLRGRAASIPGGRGRRDRRLCPQRASCRRGTIGKNSAMQQAARRTKLVAAHQSIDRTCLRLTRAKACPCAALVSSSNSGILLQDGLRHAINSADLEAQEEEPPFSAAPSHNREASNRVDRSHSVSTEWTFNEWNEKA